MTDLRRKYKPEFKTKVALEAIKGVKTIAELSHEYGVHPNQISKWKVHFLEHAPEIFANPTDRQGSEHQTEIDELYKAIGKLKVENDFLKKKVL